MSQRDKHLPTALAKPNRLLSAEAETSGDEDACGHPGPMPINPLNPNRAVCPGVVCKCGDHDSIFCPMHGAKEQAARNKFDQHADNDPDGLS